ncbi:MAG TPA: hypothetical protein VLQ93_08920 [Myxococcaceae bacterium]|nr:hypothetical protein [Myxococcaceae bacterium]
MPETSEPPRLHRRWSAHGPGSEIATVRPEEAAGGGGSSEVPPPAPPTCGGLLVPPDWPDFSSGDGEELLAPFLTCASPVEFVALQQRVAMPRLVEALDDWGAVRLGALGPVREDAAHLLQRKRAAFLVSAVERYGPFHAEVFTLFLLHSAYDDEVDAVLRLLAADKRLGQTLALMPAVRQELGARGLPLSRYLERDEQAGDVLRGLGRAFRDALATSPVADGGRYMEMSGRWKQLPPPYQHAAYEVERALAWRHFSAGSVAVGTFDAMTFASRCARLGAMWPGPRYSCPGPGPGRRAPRRRGAGKWPPWRTTPHAPATRRLVPLSEPGTWPRWWTRGWFTRGLAFERLMVALLEADAALPRAQRRFLGAFLKPRIVRYVGVWKPESLLRYADVLVIEEGGPTGGTPRVETFSFKSRDLSGLGEKALEAQMKADAREALWKYGGTLDIRRDALQPLLRGGSKVSVQRVRLVYEGGALLPEDVDLMKAAVRETESKVPGVEVLFQ